MNKKNVERELIARRKTGKNIKKANGITLLALVITIIIIIILATVAISFIFGENGLITKAQQAKLQHEIETARETLTMILGDAFVEKKTFMIQLVECKQLENSSIRTKNEYIAKQLARRR